MSGLVDFWFPGETARGEELERRNAALNQKKIEKGQMTPWEAKQQEARFEYSSEQQTADILNDAKEGAVEGLKAVPIAVKDTINSVTGWTLSAVPWWLWLVPIVYAAWYLGVFVRLRGILAKQ